ncbi:MAG: Rv3235 family protein, partial [Pseudonocardiaceae bacterium]
CPSSDPVPTVPVPPLRTAATASSAPPSIDFAYSRGLKDEEGSLTTSIAQPCLDFPQRPVLRRLVDVLPPPASVTPEPAPAIPPLAVTQPATDPGASVLAERVLRATVEILGGRRPARQVSTVLSPELLTYLATLQAVAGHLEPRVRKVFTKQQSAGVLEAVALVALSTGVRALAARFEEQHGDAGRRWRCTALQLRLTAGDVAIRRDPRRHRP